MYLFYTINTSKVNYYTSIDLFTTNRSQISSANKLDPPPLSLPNRLYLDRAAEAGGETGRPTRRRASFHIGVAVCCINALTPPLLMSLLGLLTYPSSPTSTKEFVLDT
jgi:hypothetical protein